MIPKVNLHPFHQKIVLEVGNTLGEKITTKQDGKSVERTQKDKKS